MRLIASMASVPRSSLLVIDSFGAGIQTVGLLAPFSIAHNGRLRASYGRLERVFEIEPPLGDQASHFINILRRSGDRTEQATEIAYQQFPVSNVQF